MDQNCENIINVHENEKIQSKSHRGRRRIYRFKSQNQQNFKNHKTLIKPINIQKLATQSKISDGDISLQDFEVIEEIGSGTFGTVYKVKFISSTKLLEQSSNNFYALKKISLEHKPKEMVREFFMLKNINHDNIIK